MQAFVLTACTPLLMAAAVAVLVTLARAERRTRRMLHTPARDADGLVVR